MCTTVTISNNARKLAQHQARKLAYDRHPLDAVLAVYHPQTGETHWMGIPTAQLIAEHSAITTVGDVVLAIELGKDATTTQLTAVTELPGVFNHIEERALGITH